MLAGDGQVSWVDLSVCVFSGQGRDRQLDEVGEQSVSIFSSFFESF